MYTDAILNEKLTELGYLCYNVAVDNKGFIPQARDNINLMKSCFDYILILRKNSLNSTLAQKYEMFLDDQAAELGRMCFNLYVDKKIYAVQIGQMCNLISDISKELYSDKSTVSVNDEIDIENSKVIISSSEVDFKNEEMDNYDRKHHSKEKNDFKMTLPYGMEMIPVDAKVCKCGYRNRSIAKYCGKCGAKL